VEKLYVSDPLVHDKMSLGFGKAMQPNLHWTLEHAAEFPLPLLMMHGTSDTIAFPSSSEEFTEAVGDKATLVLWKDLYHETHNELNKAEVIQTMIRWMDEHLT
jgi:alpha-beta hydrolase superfamily lysophospholipase